ncbi:hypothetical protein EW146_g6280 [Bondarzewia mesenterica]|uniref:Uncharacterized protein n=1 Tax=Bondarzewia mesenterica TaxID=1095465 RepID=A0A4S4LR38_9AGAM|nr:hypothetical protein EW146_g6280 [Bondarzewia mesenterica]
MRSSPIHADPAGSPSLHITNNPSSSRIKARPLFLFLASQPPSTMSSFSPDLPFDFLNDHTNDPSWVSSQLYESDQTLSLLPLSSLDDDQAYGLTMTEPFDGFDYPFAPLPFDFPMADSTPFFPNFGLSPTLLMTTPQPQLEDDSAFDLVSMSVTPLPVNTELNQASPTRDLDSEDSSDEDFIPTPSPPTRRRTAPTRQKSTTSSSKRPRLSPRSRNAQVGRSSPSYRSASSASSSPSTSKKCPHCDWVQLNGRQPDLNRHVATHERDLSPPKWVCRGVPLEHAAAYDVSPDAEPTSYGEQGKFFVGGCGKTFSRRDALKRHLDNENIECKGDLTAMLDWGV